jgi:hypothetical protein
MSIKKRTEAVNLSAAGDTAANVILNVTIGNAQIGGNLAKWSGSNEVLKKGAIQNLNLGTTASVKGKTLSIITNVLDVNDQTNGIVVTYSFQNCIPITTTFNDTVDNEADIFSLTVNFTFN